MGAADLAFTVAIGMCAVGLTNSGTILEYISDGVRDHFGTAGTGVTVIDVKNTAKLKTVLFGGDPWLIHCVTNKTKIKPLLRVLEETTSSLNSSLGVRVGVLKC